MKRFIAGLFFMIFSVNSHAVLCEIITKDPRYNVASYNRNQTACRTTNYANATSIGSQIARVGTLFLVISALEYISEKNTDSKIEEILSGDYKTIQCYNGNWHPSIPNKITKFLVGKNYAVNQETRNSYSKTSDRIYENKGFFGLGYKLDLNSMKVSGNGANGVVDYGCSILQEVRNGEVGNEFLITVEWEDKNKDIFKVFAQGSDQAIEAVKDKFKNSNTKIESVYFDLKADSSKAVNFQ